MKNNGVLTALAVAVTALGSATNACAQSSVTLYGLIDAGVDYVSNQRSSGSTGGKTFALQSNNLSKSNWGLRGSEDLGAGLKAIFDLESGFSVSNGRYSNGGDEFGQQAFVGLKSEQFGEITLGRQYDDVNDFVAPYSAAGGFGGNLASHPFDSDNMAGSMRMNNSVKVRSREYYGFQVGGGYGFSNLANGIRQNNAFTAGGKYTWGGLALAGGFFQANNPGSTTGGSLSSSDGDAQLLGQRQRIYAAAIHYDTGPAEFGFVFSRTSVDGPTQIAQGGGYIALPGNFMTLYNYELNARYALTPELHVGAAYTYTQGHFVGTTSTVYPKWSQLMVQADYSLSPRTDVYLEGTYQHVSSTGNSAFNASIYNFGPSSNNKQAIVAVGMRTRF